MVHRVKTSQTARDTIATGIAALQAGDLETARRLLDEAANGSRRDPGVLVNLGLTLQRLGEIDEAAVMMCDALALKPGSTDIAGRFSTLVRRFHVKRPCNLNASGLKAALAFDTFDRQPFVELAIGHALGQPELSDAMASTRAGEAEEAAANLLEKRTAKGLRNDLLLLALERGKNTDPWFERLLVVLRRLILLALPEERFHEDRVFLQIVSCPCRAMHRE